MLWMTGLSRLLVKVEGRRHGRRRRRRWRDEGKPLGYVAGFIGSAVLGVGHSAGSAWAEVVLKTTLRTGW